ncbi:hypothetical protein [Pseudomonas aeruginosa]|uniref:hypothetical protein n=1 Tax=Pseudomonas aeruginosa TaxID=287 RepID=UPI00158A2D94|nr:hypothetical protein [Pseudomonas aeruginosa]
MMGVGGLVKKDVNPAATSPEADNFINAAKVDGKNSSAAIKPGSTKVFKRVTFSLTDPISEEIDRLSLIPRGFRASRSDVVRAGVAALSAMTEEQVVALLEKVHRE